MYRSTGLFKNKLASSKWLNASKSLFLPMRFKLPLTIFLMEWFFKNCPKETGWIDALLFGSSGVFWM
ncbi:hypothetical protein evm_014887 [Chilo suppressalis]|nr:hypothetical protein evm_014887 [Chilo suppressalis]